MQHNNDRRQLSPYSSRYDEGSKYPYRSAPGQMEEETNAYARSSHYDKTPFDAQQGSSRDSYNREQDYYASWQSRSTLNERAASGSFRQTPTTYHAGDGDPGFGRYAPSWSSMDPLRSGNDISFGANDRPQARRSATTALARTDHDMDIELSKRERSSSFNTYRAPSPREDPLWEREPHADRLSSRPSTSSAIPLPPARRSAPGFYERNLSPQNGASSSYTPTPPSAEVHIGPRYGNSQTIEDRRPIRPLPTGPRSQLVSQFASQTPPSRQTNLPPSSESTFHRPFSPRRSSASSERHYAPQNMFFGTARDRSHSFDRSIEQRSGVYHGRERDRLSISTRVDPVPQQSPKRVETLRESLVRDKTRPDRHLGLHGDQAYIGPKTDRTDRAQMYLDAIASDQKRVERFNAKFEEMLTNGGLLQRRRDYRETLERGKLPILSPQLRVLHLLPPKPAWAAQPSSVPQRKSDNSGTSQKNGKAPPTGPRYLREQQNAKAAAPNLRIEITGSIPIAKSTAKNATADDERSSTASTPRPPPTDDDQASEDSSSVAETPTSPPATSWQGATTSFRASLLRVLANERAHQMVIVNRVKGAVDAENRLTVKSHDVRLRGPAFFKYTPPNIKPKPNAREMESALRLRFRAQGNALEAKVEGLKREYKRISKKWERQCQKLDEQNPPEEIVPIPIPETPLTARTGRRNRTGLSDMIHSEFDLEQFVQKQVESDKVDAELLGRMNAAELPDMISVTRESWHGHIYNDTNALVHDAADVYNYWAADAWADEERVAFSQILAEVGKKFGIIAANPALHNRTVQDCVRYYYRSKADEKYKDLLRGLFKKTGKRSESRGATTVGELGGLLADIRAGEGRRKGGREDEVEESSDSAYEQEQRRRPGRGRGRGKGRGRGGGRGGARGNAAAREQTPIVDPDGDVDMADTNGSDGGSPPIPGLSLPSFDGIPPPGTNSRKRKHRAEDGDDAGGSGLGSRPMEKKKPISSYWTVADREKIAALIEVHGDDFGAIAAELSQKSLNQVKNYIKGRRDLSEVLDRVLLDKAVTASYLTTPIDAPHTRNAMPDLPLD